MRKMQIFGLVLFAVFASSAVAATSAFAVHEWLLEGVAIPIGQKDLVDSETGELLLEDTKGGITGGKVDILCSGLNEGWVFNMEPPGPNGPGLDEVTEVLNLAMTSSNITDCVNDEGCVGAILVEAVNLPWETELLLNAAGQFRDLVGPGAGGTQPGWTATCSGVPDTCTGHTNVLIENNVAEKDVEALFESAGENTEFATCTRGGANTGLVEGTVLILTEVGTLAVS